ncbi:MAG: FHA domain-containing protein [Chloroflexota bacterium]
MDDQLAQIFNEYTRLRLNGLQATEAVNALRPHINELDESNRTQLARNLRAWEGQRTEAITTINRERLQSAAHEQATTQEITCPTCGKLNAPTALTCYSCGKMLDVDKLRQSTDVLASGTDELESTDFLTDSVLVFMPTSGDGEPMRLQPQLGTSQLTIGRNHDAPTANPDVDLDAFGAATKGVSRIHATIAYDKHTETLFLIDMCSTNGTFVNGRRLKENERRSLRSGDAIRFGRLRLNIHFER